MHEHEHDDEHEDEEDTMTMKLDGRVPRERSPALTGARIAVVGYGPPGRAHALALRRAGNDVAVALRLGGMSWVRARADGFRAEPPSLSVPGAVVAVVQVPDDEQASLYVHAIEPHLEPGALLVFGRGVALEAGALAPRGFDVVLVTGFAGEATDAAAAAAADCRVAVHHDATGAALERAVRYARAVFGHGAHVGTTTLAAEAHAELAAMAERAGGVAALRRSVARSLGLARESHAPDETKVAFYEGLVELIDLRGADLAQLERGSATSLAERPR